MSKIVGAFGIAVMVLVMAAGFGGSSSEAAYGPGSFTPPTRLPSTIVNGQSFNVIAVRSAD